METYRLHYDELSHKGYLDTTRQLLDGLMIYRPELGETGRRLELLLRRQGVTASVDVPCPERVQ